MQRTEGLKIHGNLVCNIPCRLNPSSLTLFSVERDADAFPSFPFRLGTKFFLQQSGLRVAFSSHLQDFSAAAFASLCLRGFPLWLCCRSLHRYHPEAWLDSPLLASSESKLKKELEIERQERDSLLRNAVEV